MFQCAMQRTSSCNLPVFQVSEDIPESTPFGVVYAVDRDGLRQIIYTSTMTSEFLVNPISGELLKGQGVVLDFENM